MTHGSVRRAILCDGLDECGDRAPWVTQQLAELLQSLHPRTGFVLATRASAQKPAARLDLPRVELSPPEDLSSTVDEVLAVCADTRASGANRDAWLASRRAWISGAKVQHSQLLTVPLLAILLALVCASATDAELPKGRATLLHRAVEESVCRWEQTRATLTADRLWSPKLTNTMLLRGFVVLGRLVEGVRTPSRLEAIAQLTARLRDPAHWAMPPATAEEVAAEILRFWDEHVAVFVLNAANELTARSKVFAEIATAMWASDCDEEQLKEWLSGALTSTDSDGAIGLAADLEPRVVSVLVEVGNANRPDATLIVADLAYRGIATLAPGDSRRILDQLTAAVLAHRDGDQTPKRRRKNPSRSFETLSDTGRYLGVWDFVQAACLLPLPQNARGQRAVLIAEAALEDQAQTIATALCALTDATADNRALDEASAAGVNAALAIPLPPKADIIQKSRRRIAFVSGKPLTPGLDRVAFHAVGRLNELEKSAGESILQIAKRSNRGTAEEIFAELARAGFDTNRWWGTLTTGLREWLSAHKDHETVLLSDLSSIADPPPPNTGDDLWSLTEFSDLLAATDYTDVAASEFDRAFLYDSAEVRRSWLVAVADAYGISKSAIARQARHLEQLQAVNGANATLTEWLIAAVKPLEDPSLREDLEAVLTTEQQLTLISCLEAESDWIARAAAAILVNVVEPHWDSQDLFDKDMSCWHLDRAGLLYMVAILSAGDQADSMLARAASSESVDYRYAARLSVSVVPDLDSNGVIMQALRQDDDLSIRPKDARKDVPSPSRWTCAYCRSQNSIEIEDCPACEEGVRPDN